MLLLAGAMFLSLTSVLPATVTAMARTQVGGIPPLQAVFLCMTNLLLYAIETAKARGSTHNYALENVVSW